MMSNHKGKGLAMFALLGMLEGLTQEQIVDSALRGMQCNLCAQGLPVKDGKHNIMGVEIECDAEPKAQP